ncbi:MAG: DUF1934 domain-containing protein [Ruminococcus sp.]|nr:DUF1934 domain-containing protein [Ruminococcus sp.]
MKKKDVSIKLISTQSDGENKEQTELFSRGTYERTAKGYRISYDESEATGYQGSTTALETFEGGKVIMDRTGQVSSNLIIEKNAKHHCVYGTPYGSFTIGVNAKQVDSTLDDNGGRLFMHYVIDVNSGYVGDFEISVEVTPL